MKKLPFIEDIYDMETEDLQTVLQMLTEDMILGEGNCSLPQGIETFEKYERKAAKLRDCLELELEERSQVDNVINFFTDQSANFLDDDAFYKLDEIPTDISSNSVGKTNNMTRMTDYLNSTTVGPSSGLSVYSTPYRYEQFENTEQALLKKIDPQGVMDDYQSIYSSSYQDSEVSKAEPSYQSGVMPRGKMTKYQLAAFMKAKLAKTKVSGYAISVTGSGPTNKNFTAPKSNKEPTRGKDFLTGTKPKPKPASFRKPYAYQKEDSDNEMDDIAAANAKMMEAAQKFKGDGQGAKKSSRRVERQYQNQGDHESHKTTVINTSKNIYKPSFNLPAKEKPERPPSATRKAAVPRQTPQSTVSYSQKKAAIQDQKPPKKPPLQRKASQSKISKYEPNAYKPASKVYTKPNIPLSKYSSRQTPQQKSETSSKPTATATDYISDEEEPYIMLSYVKKDKYNEPSQQAEADPYQYPAEVSREYQEEILSRYSDGEGEDNEKAVENFGETGTTRNVAVELEESKVRPGSTMTVGSKRSTQDLLLERAESLGDFKQFKEYPAELDRVEVPEVGLEEKKRESEIVAEEVREEAGKAEEVKEELKVESLEKKISEANLLPVAEENESYFYSFREVDQEQYLESLKEEVNDEQDIQKQDIEIEVRLEERPKNHIPKVEPESAYNIENDQKLSEQPKEDITQSKPKKRRQPEESKDKPTEEVKPKKETMLDRVRKRIETNPEERIKEQEERKQYIEQEIQQEAEEKKQESAKKEKDRTEPYAETAAKQESVKEDKQDDATPAKPPKASTGQATAKKKPARYNQFKQVPRNIVLDEEQKDSEKIFNCLFLIILKCFQRVPLFLYSYL